MKKIYIKTTEACNLKCEHCYIGDNRKKTEFFDVDTTINWLKKYIDKYNLDEKEILFSFHGGEPFLCPTNIMQKLCNAFLTAQFDATTNLVYTLTPEHISFITNNFIFEDRPFIKTSWDYVIRFKNSFEEDLWHKNIKILQKNDVRIKVTICLTSLLIKEIEPWEIFGFLAENNIKDVNFERLTLNTTQNMTLVPNYKDQDQWLLDFYRFNQGRLNVDNFIDIEHACRREFIGCRKRQCMKDVITINADGTIGGCPNSSIKKYYGSIYEEPISENVKHCILIRNEEIRNPKCYYCDLYEICNGDCHQLSWREQECPAPKRLIREIKRDLEK